LEACSLISKIFPLDIFYEEQYKENNLQPGKIFQYKLISKLFWLLNKKIQKNKNKFNNLSLEIQNSFLIVIV
jgi:hypothetical protein